MPKVYKIKSQIDFISAEKPNLDKNSRIKRFICQIVWFRTEIRSVATKLPEFQKSDWEINMITLQ